MILVHPPTTAVLLRAARVEFLGFWLLARIISAFSLRSSRLTGKSPLGVVFIMLLVGVYGCVASSFAGVIIASTVQTTLVATLCWNFEF